MSGYREIYNMCGDFTWNEEEARKSKAAQV